MISASSDVIDKKVEKYRYSNGNCELTTVEMVQMEMAVLALYLPSGKNFSLEKFSDVMNKARTYLTELRANKPQYKVIFCGDFNFPEVIVRWVSTEDGLIADPIAGNDRRKLAFDILQELAIDFGIEQIVGKPTREKAILDLIYTDCPERISEPRVEVLIAQ